MLTISNGNWPGGNHLMKWLLIVLICATAPSNTSAIQYEDISIDSIQHDSTEFQVSLIPPSFYNPKSSPDLMVVSERNISVPDWIFWILLTISVIGALQFAYSREMITASVNAIANFKLAGQIHRNREYRFNIAGLLLELLFFLQVAFIVMLLLISVSDKYNTTHLSSLFIYSSAVLILFYLLQTIFRRAASSIFGFAEKAGFFRFSISAGHRIAALALIPFVWIAIYARAGFSEAGLYICLIIIALHFLYLLVRGLTISQSYRGFDYFHFVLYICTLEIAPVMLLFQVVTEWFPVS